MKNEDTKKIFHYILLSFYTKYHTLYHSYEQIVSDLII